MVDEVMTILCRTCLLLAVMAGCVFGTKIAVADDPSLSTQNRYPSLKRFCGRDEVPLNESEIPWIGCLYLSSGHKAVGVFANHKVEVGVDQNGSEQFSVDGVSIEYMHGEKKTASGTNFPYVHAGGVAGFSFCRDESSASCPSSITVHSRNEDKSILFSVTECLPPDYHLCVTNQTNWDYETSHANQLNQPRTRSPVAQAPLPSGPYSSWPEEVKKPALASLTFRCGMASVMALGNYQGSKEAGKEMAQALAIACVDRQMPEDWPGHGDARAALKLHDDAAHKLDPALPDPVALMSHLPPG